MKINLEDVKYVTEVGLVIRGSRRRITVPKVIVDHFELKDKDKIRWVLLRDNTIVLVPIGETKNKGV